MTISVPGWSRVDYLLEYLVNSNISMIFLLFGIFVDDKMKKVGIKKDSLVNILNIPDISNTAKTGSVSKMVDRVKFWLIIKKFIKIIFYLFLRRLYNERVIHFLCLFLHVQNIILW